MTTPLEDFAARFEAGDESALPFMVGAAVLALRERLEPADAEIIAQWLAAMLTGDNPFPTEGRGRRPGGRNAERGGWARPNADVDNLDIAWSVHRRVMVGDRKTDAYRRVGKTYGLSSEHIRRIYRENLPTMPKRVIGLPNSEPGQK